MRELLIMGILILICGIAARAQYVPNSNQAFQFASGYNPAFTGVESYKDLKLGYRYQWTGFGANAPKFINILYNFRLNQPLALQQNALRTSIPYSRIEVPKSKRIVHAIGASLFNEEVGVINRLGGGVNYSFHYPIQESKNIRVATGLSVMYENTRVDINKIYMGNNPDPDPFYDKLLKNGANRADLNVRAGMLVYSPAFYVGFCYLPLLNIPIQTTEGNFADLFYRGTLQAGVSFSVTSDIELKPSVLGLWQINNEVLFDYSLKTYYQQKIWLGVTYRDTKSGVGLIGFNLNELLVAAYSYEVPLNSLRQFSDGSHELVLTFKLNNFKGYNPYLW